WVFCARCAGVVVSEPVSTIFISYTPQDEAAARRVALALRRAGLEVVFERAGEPVAAARAAIADCALFLPIISQNTQERAEGGFRSEWAQAAQRVTAMANPAGFMVPVLVDATSQREAQVPEAFRQFSWMRMDVWTSPEALVARVQELLTQRAAAAEAARMEQEEAVRQAARSWLKRWVRRLPPWVRRGRVVFVVTLVLLPGGVWVVREVARVPSDEPG